MAEQKKGLDLKKPVARPKVPIGLLFRMFVIGSIAVVAAGYAIYRYYFVPRTPMLVPAPPPTEVPAPEIVPAPPSSS